MQALSLAQIAAATDGRLLGDDRPIERVITDSRAIAAGDLFVALRGERFDGNDFLAEAGAAGAAAAVVTREPDGTLPCVLVRDSLLALGRIAHLNRRAFTGPVIAVSGSSGKTSCKEMIAAILRRAGEVLVTRGNLNNEIGVPLTLLGIAPQHRFAVIEMGASGLGDIRYLCDFARPGIALLTNAQPAHLEGFGSLENVARAKGEIYESLQADGTAVINADDDFCGLWQSLAGTRRQVLFSLRDAAADYFARDIRQDPARGMRFTLVTPAGESDIRLPLLGRHMVANALAAAAAAMTAGADLTMVREGLAAVTPVPGRLYPRTVGDVLVIDDSYNANPGSTRAAIDVLGSAAGRKFLAMGNMAELGEESQERHREIGAYAAARGVDRLLAVGPSARVMVEAFGVGGEVFEDRGTLAQALLAALQPGDTVLVKGSRSAGMDAVTETITAGIDSRGER